MSDSSNQSDAKTTHPIAAIVVFTCLVAGCIELKRRGFVGEVSFVTLLTGAGVSGFLVYFQRRVKKAGPSGFELYEAVREIREAELSVKSLATAVLELAEADEDGFKASSWDEARYEMAKENLRKLIEQR